MKIIKTKNFFPINDDEIKNWIIRKKKNNKAKKARMNRHDHEDRMNRELLL